MKQNKALLGDGGFTGETISGGKWRQCGGSLTHFRPFANEMKADVVDQAWRLFVLILLGSLHLSSG